MWKVIIVLILTSGLGGLAAYGSYNCTKAWAIPVLATIGGLMVGVLLAGALNQKGIKMIGICVVCAIAFGYIGKKLNKIVKTGGTAFIGASIVVQGVAMQFPKISAVVDSGADQDIKDPTTLYILGGTVVLFIAGFATQMYLFRDDEEEEGKDDDFMAAEDETRTCGCF